MLSVIICTHNPRAEYLRRTLSSLRAQTEPADRWELILVDNGSKNVLAETCDLSWHPRGRHVREDTLGLTPARLRGIAEASGDALVFVDDDNVLDPEFLGCALKILETHPHLGVIGAGMLVPEFEIPPSVEIQPWLKILALRSISESFWSNNPSDGSCIPWGAGLVVTRQVGLAYTALVDRLRVSAVLDRRGEHLFCGGDDLFSWAAAECGLGFGIFADLRIVHLISAGRLTKEYFLRLIHDGAHSHAVLRYVLTDSVPQRLSLPRRVWLGWYGLKNGLFEMQCILAAARGEMSAARFVAHNGLKSVRRHGTLTASEGLDSARLLRLASAATQGQFPG
jgi:glycosyltransferase involved in cell wall biosynthesis